MKSSRRLPNASSKRPSESRKDLGKNSEGFGRHVQSNPGKAVYEFGPFRLDPAEHTLLRSGQPVALAPKVFDILALLVEKNGHLFAKEELMQAVWPDSFVEEGNLTRNISTLRTVLAERPDDQYIETVPKRGYRFVARVREVDESTEREWNEQFQPGNSEEDHSFADGVSEAQRMAQQKLLAIRESEQMPDRRATWRVSLRSPRDLVMVGVTIVALAGLAYALFSRRAPVARRPEIKSLAVLPLKSLSKDANDDYLGLGIADTIIMKVSQNGELTVRPTSAVRKYANQEINSLEAAQQLKVDSVLDGTVQRVGDRLHINLNLLSTQDGASLWSDSFNVSLTDILKMQDQVAQQVATRLRLKLRSQTQISSVNPQAYDFYLRAKYHAGLESKTEIEATIELLERAVAIDPSFALAHAELSHAYSNKAANLKPEEKEWEEKAFVAVEKALALDPDLADAHLSRGVLLWAHSSRFLHEKAIQEYHRALELNPNLAEAHHQLANVYNHIGLLDKAQEEVQKALAINPGIVGARFRVGVNLLYQGKDEQALEAFRDSERFHPELWSYQTACALFHLGRREEAAARVAEALKNNPQDEGGTLTSIQALLAASAGDVAVAEAKIKRAAELGKDFRHFHHTAYTIACAYALLNKAEPAMKWLQLAADDGFPCYPLFDHDPNLDHLRQDRHFIAFMMKLKAQWEHYQATLYSNLTLGWFERPPVIDSGWILIFKRFAKVSLRKRSRVELPYQAV
jgi:DNA-binding winged helix-turn-helix (wHTH) protein/TolB-like protein/Tfp pilus assembly protein PilF